VAEHSRDHFRVRALPPMVDGGAIRHCLAENNHGLLTCWEVLAVKLTTCIITISLLCLTSCADQRDVQKLEARVLALENRVTELDKKLKEVETSRDERRTDLQNCIDFEAEDAYWNVVRLNGKQVKGKPGVWNAPAPVWEMASRSRQEKIEECKVRYGK
jgi:hypothetical protein